MRPTAPAACRRQRPFVLVNMAMSADGKIATANRAVSSFTSPTDQAHLLALRATADAVMCGARTVDLNEVRLDPGPARYRQLRRRRGLAEYNLRIIVSGSGSLDPRAAIFRHRFSPIIILTKKRIAPGRLDRLQDVADAVKVCGETEIDFPRALQWLRRQWGVKRLLCEGGGELNAALFRNGLVDELHLTVAPRIIGGQDAPTIAEGLGRSHLAQATPLALKSQKQMGDELYVVYQRSPDHFAGQCGSPAPNRA